FIQQPVVRRETDGFFDFRRGGRHCGAGFSSGVLHTRVSGVEGGSDDGAPLRIKLFYQGLKGPQRTGRFISEGVLESGAGFCDCLYWSSTRQRAESGLGQDSGLSFARPAAGAPAGMAPPGPTYTGLGVV